MAEKNMMDISSVYGFLIPKFTNLQNFNFIFLFLKNC